MNLAHGFACRAVRAAAAGALALGLFPACDEGSTTPKKEFLLVATMDSTGTEFGVTTYKVGSDGALDEKATLVLAGAQSITDFAVHPHAPFAYLADEAGMKIHAITLTETGKPVPTPRSPFDVSPRIPSLLDVAADGGYLAFAAETDGIESLHTYIIDPADGDLVVQDTAVTIANQASGVTSHPEEHVVYVTNSAANEVSAYELHEESPPTLLGAQTVASGASPRSAAVAADGANLFVVEDANDQVAVFPLAASGAIQAGTDLKAVGGGPIFAAVSPDGTLLYVTNLNDGTLSAFTVDRGGGLLEAVNGSPFLTEASPLGITFARKGQFLYVAHYIASLISGYAVDKATGVLTALAGFPLETEAYPVWMRIIRR